MLQRILDPCYPWSPLDRCDKIPHYLFLHFLVGKRVTHFFSLKLNKNFWKTAKVFVIFQMTNLFSTFSWKLYSFFFALLIQIRQCFWICVFTAPHKKLFRHFSFWIAFPLHDILIPQIYYISVKVWRPFGVPQTGFFSPKSQFSPIGSDTVPVENAWHEAQVIIYLTFQFWCSKELLRT